MSSDAGKKSKSDTSACKHSELKLAARQCYEEGDFLEAKILYERILDRNSEDLQTLCNLAKVLFQLGDFRAAKSAANRVISLDSTNETGYHVVAKVAEKLGDLDECARLLEIGMEKCDYPYLLEDYYDEVMELKDAKEMESLMKKKPENKAAESKKKTENSASLPLPDDCPDLISDSDSDSDNEAPVTNKVSKPVKAVSKLVNNESFIQQDEFMKTVLSVAKEKNLTYDDVANNRVQKFKGLCKEGSEAYLEGIYRKSIDKYKEAFDLIDDLPLNLFKISEIDYAVLKYMLCLLRIRSANYENLVSAIQILQDLEEKQARTLPSVYYLLGLAYQTLNRNKHALDVGEKGLSFLEKDIQFESQPYPQVYEIIPETRKKDLQEKLEQLVNNCRIYRQPDAVCRFSKCHSVNNHIIPSCSIYYSDPDFTGYVSAICEEHCKICFHLNCWRSWKEGIADGRKVTDKDVLGLDCFTEDCETECKLHSKIIQIDIIGTDGQVKSSVKGVKSNLKRDNKRTDSVSSDRLESAAKKEKKTEVATVEKPTEPAAAKEKVDKSAKKHKKAVEVAQVTPSKTKNNTNNNYKETKDDSEDIVKIETPSNHVDLAPKLNKLKKLREMNFGYTNSGDLDPEKMDYGIEMDSTEPMDFGISVPDKECSNTVEFILSMFYGFLRSEGPQKKSDVIRKWEEEKGDLDPNLYVHKNYKGICELLLQSYHFCQVGSYIAISKQVHVAHKLLVKDYENCKQKPVSESEDYTSDYHISGSTDGNANDLKSHPPDSFSSALKAKTKSTSSGKKIVPISENKEYKTQNNNNSNPASNKNNKTNTTNLKNNDSDKANIGAPTHCGSYSDENIKNISDVKKTKAPEGKKSKVNPAPEIIKVPEKAAALSPRAKPGISRSKLTELIDSKFENGKENAKEPETKEFEEINVRKIKKIKSATAKLADKKSLEDQRKNAENKSIPLEEQSNPLMKAITEERPNPFLKSIEKSEEDNEFECYNVKSTNTMLRSKLELNKNKNGLHTESTRRWRILEYLNNHLESNVDKKENEEVTENKKYHFPGPKASDLSQDEVVTSTNTQFPVPVPDPIECREIACQTLPIEETAKTAHDKLLEMYKSEIEEWKEKNKNLELMLVESYNTNAEVTEELDDLKEKYKKSLEEKAAAIKIRNDTIQELREIIEANEMNGKIDKNDTLKQLKDAKKLLMDLQKELGKVANDSGKVKELTKDLRDTEDFLITVMKDYVQLLLKNFKEKTAGKIEALDIAAPLCTDETDPSKNQVDVVKKKWEEARSEISSKIREYKKQLEEEARKISEGEKPGDLKNLYTPMQVLSTIEDDLFDPIPALLTKFIEDINKLAVIVMQHVPPPLLHQMNLRSMLVDRSRLPAGPVAVAPRPPQQFFFPIYQPVMPQPLAPSYVQSRMPKPPPPFPVKEKKSRTPSESSTKSDLSVQSEVSTISDISKADSEKSSGSKKSKKKKKTSESEESTNSEAKGKKGKNENANDASCLKFATASPKSLAMSSKPAFSNLTAVNSSASSLKSSERSTSPTLQKLVAYLRKQLKNVTEAELEKSLRDIRKTNRGTLSGLELETLAEKVREQLKLRPKNASSLLYVKYTGPAWGTVKEEKIDWDKKEQGVVDCVICFERLSTVNYIQLTCKHEFHETCIKKWFKEASVCPTCKRRCLLQDEYPPLQ